LRFSGGSSGLGCSDGSFIGELLGFFGIEIHVDEFGDSTEHMAFGFFADGVMLASFKLGFASIEEVLLVADQTSGAHGISLIKQGHPT